MQRKVGMFGASLELTHIKNRGLSSVVAELKKSANSNNMF
jgi:hypothetical protein